MNDVKHERVWYKELITETETSEEVYSNKYIYREWPNASFLPK